MKKLVFSEAKIKIITGILLLIIINSSCFNKLKNNQVKSEISSGKLRVSHLNSHLLETNKGKPVLINNYTAWKLIQNGKREEIDELLTILLSQKFNMISFVLFNNKISDEFVGVQYSFQNDTSAYGKLPFACDSYGNPDLSRPNTTEGNNPMNQTEYDYWDHVDFTINLAAKKGMYTCLNPTWGNWVSGKYNGPTPDDHIIFNKTNAYNYGFWLGERYGSKDNVLWMLGGDRSAIYNNADGSHDYRTVWSAMAEGLADGVMGVKHQDGNADYNDLLISYHPRKWAPNSSEWFHNEAWLSFNSIQDTPYDQIVSLPHDYNLKPVKPTWLFEGRYEGATSAWAVRYQAYQTVLAGGFGSTYGNDNWLFPPEWRKIANLPGAWQMGNLYLVCREIWTDNQFLNRIPDQELIIGDQGETIGDGMTVGDGDGGPDSEQSKDGARSDRLTAMRGKNGKWAIVYSANGRNITLNLTRLKPGEMNAYWFNPRNGKWIVKDKEYDKPTPFLTGLRTGSGNFTFEALGNPEPNNDWVLVLKE